MYYKIKFSGYFIGITTGHGITQGFSKISIHTETKNFTLEESPNNRKLQSFVTSQE